MDLLFSTGGSVPVDMLWDDPGFIRISRRLEAFGRIVWFQARGSGASEGTRNDSLVDEIANADISAVLDATGCDQVTLLSLYGSANLIVFAASHPERVRALVLLNAWAHYVRESDYPWGIPREDLDRIVASSREDWGTGPGLEFLAPSRSDDEHFRAWWARGARLGAGPEEAIQAVRAGFELDLRPMLPTIAVPTLVIHREGDRYIRLGAGRYLAEHIPGAKFVVLPGDDHLFFVGDTDALVDEIEEFLTGARSGATGEAMMAAVLFTDIVASTEHQARVGPRAWSRLTDRHDALVRSALVRHRGREVKQTGDGFLATFDATGRALRCAAEVVNDLRGIGLELRAGVHSGDVEIRGDDIAGLAVTIAKRVCDMAGPGEVLVSETARGHMAGSGIEFEDRGEHELKGVPGSWRLFALKD